MNKNDGTMEPAPWVREALDHMFETPEACELRKLKEAHAIIIEGRDIMIEHNNLRIRELTAALYLFGRHKYDCGAGMSSRARCMCGLTDVVR